MADFAAVLKKTLAGIKNPGPETRTKVYERARATIDRQIEALPKRPSDEVIQRQYAKLDAAIAEVEAEYETATVEDEIAAAMAQEETPEEPAVETPPAEPTITEEPAPAAEEPAPAPPPEPEAIEDDALADETAGEPTEEDIAAAAEPEPEPEPEPVDEIFAEPQAPAAEERSEEPVFDTGMSDDEAVQQTGIPPEAPAEKPARPAVDDSDPLAAYLAEEEAASRREDEETDEVTAAAAAEAIWDAQGERRDTPPPAPARRGGMGRIALVAILLLLIGAGGYAAWRYQDEVVALIGGDPAESEVAVAPAETQEPVTLDEEPQPSETAPAEDTASEDGLPVREVPSTTISPEDTETAAPAEETPSEDTQVASAEPETEKFTQRLTPEGEEIDEGPAQTAEVTGEGTSVAGQTPGTGSEDDAADAEAPAGEATAAGDEDAVAVGQRAIFYQERTGTQAGTAEAGSVVWSVIEEPPADGLPPEPAIRAEASIPDLGLTMEMTIRRDVDETFPASHVIELFFTVPESFEGRGIADVQRITFKGTEQDPGNALIGVAAALDTNIFMIALTDASTAIETNLSMMRREDWIDIPMQYVSGRRALITLEKGIPGEQVFNEVLSAWESSPPPETAPDDGQQ